MKTCWTVLGLIVFASLMSACTRNSDTVATPSQSPTAAAQQPDRFASQVPANQTAQNPFPQPTVSAPRSQQNLPVPQLIPPTASLERMPQINAGRPDPFSTLVVPATVSYRPATPTPAASTPGNPSAMPVPAVSTVPLTTVPVTALPPLPPVQAASTDINQLPPVVVPGRLTTPGSLAQAIEISGVVEVGGKTNVIVKVPDEHTSRYVGVGEYLANGNVLVKRVEMGAEPVVILEENGTEVTRYIGSGSTLAGLM